MKILEVASQEIDRFGWQMMDKGVKDDIFENWCDELEPYSLNKIKSAIRLLFKKSKGNLRTINAFQVIDAIDEINHAERAKLPKAPKEQEAPRSAPDDDEISRSRSFAAERGYRIPKALTAQQIEDGKK